MIIRWPEVSDAATGTCDDSLRYNIDLAATVCEVAGAPIPDAWHARSMAKAVRGDPDTGREFLVLSQLAQTCQRSVLFRHAGADWLYIRTYRSGHYVLPREMLFALTRDPHEVRDLAESRPDLVAMAAGMLDGWREGMLADGDHGDPMEAVLAEEPQIDLETYVKQLRDSGREEMIDPVRRQAAKEQKANG
jgi:arylsulfatase A-like enzyme